MVQLTEQLVLSRAKADSLATVKNLNLWGNDLTDVSILQNMPNVEVLSLSVNKISSLAEFGRCPKLVELYLRKNSVGNLGELVHLMPLRNLKVLWLCDNPCADEPSYRKVVVRALPLLAKLDNLDITSEERAEAQKVPLSLIPDSLRPYIKGVTPDVPTAAPLQARPPSQSSMAAPPAAQAAAPSAAAAGGDAPRRSQWQQDRRVVESIRAAADAQQPQPQPAPSVRDSRIAAPSSAGIASVSVVPASGAAAAGRYAGPAAMPSQGGAGGRSGKSSNVLYAVLALLKELSEEDLLIVRAELEQRMQQ